jgi:acetyltransferase-like isoleucine patch superfamily enzyme
MTIRDLLKSTLAAHLRNRALRDRRYENLWRRVANPSGLAWAELLRERGDFHSMGAHCSISPFAQIEDRHLIRFGSNVRLATCTMFGHDGSVNMINRARSMKLDKVGRIDIRDNVFIGYQAVILPGVTIGPNAIVAAGSVVRRDVAEGDIVAGAPARPVGRVDDFVQRLVRENARWPWIELLQRREHELDHSLEPELARMRSAYFWSEPPALELAAESVAIGA